jgi:abequosyltransferase
MTSAPTVMNERPLLTIAIPTYNRALLLGRLLSTLFEQTRNESRVEVIVSDNASPDNTIEIVQKFLSLGMSLRYIRNTEDLGPDANLLQCYEQAAGKYVWVFGDDDMIEPGGLSAILKHLSADDYDLVYVSARGYKGEYVPIAQGRAQGVLVYKQPEEFSRRLHIMFTFISANIVNKDRVSDLKHEPFSVLKGTNLVQLGWIYTALDSLRKGLLIQDTLVAGLMDNSGGYSVFSTFGPKFKSITDTWINSRGVRRAILSGMLQGYLPRLILDSKHNKDSFFRSQSGSALRVAFGSDPRYWIFDVPVTVLPRPLDHCWVFLARVVSKLEYLIRWRLLKRAQA